MGPGKPIPCRRAPDHEELDTEAPGHGDGLPAGPRRTQQVSSRSDRRWPHVARAHSVGATKRAHHEGANTSPEAAPVPGARCSTRPPEPTQGGLGGDVGQVAQVGGSRIDVADLRQARGDHDGGIAQPE
eukprot:5183497-Alexandrium_andersonii.AAC.1